MNYRKECDQLRAAIKKVSDYNGRLEVTNDQLRARVADLEVLVEVTRKELESRGLYGEANLLLRPKSMSLAAIEARVLREFAEKFFGNSHITSDIKAKHKMLEEADRIEKGGGAA